MKILLTGGSGQLGKSIIKLKPLNIDLIAPDRSKLDLSRIESCIKFVKKEKPDWIINCGAFTNVDKAESEKENVFLINHEAPKTSQKFFPIMVGNSFILVLIMFSMDAKINHI